MMQQMRRGLRLVMSAAVGMSMMLAVTTAAIANEPREETQPAPQAVDEENGYQYLGGATYRVYGYREGLVGYTTANGHVIQPNDRFVALPCFCVLSSDGGYEYQVKLEYNGKEVIAPVWDVGPWNTDDNYWDPPEQRNWTGLPQGYPAAAAAYYDGYNGGRDSRGRVVGSPGGIDIGDGTFADLGMTGSDWVTVTFLWMEPQRWELPPLPAAFNDISTTWWNERPPIDPVPAISDGRFGYFSETGHNVPNGLLGFYWANGSISRFGFPISEFYREVNMDGTIRYVQNFERATLVLDPATDAVSIDALGYDSYIDPVAWQQVAWFENTPSALYFADTGHSLQNGFKAYWEANGGVGVFGRPISEEWSEIRPDGRKVVMQMFENARLEWWPDLAGTGTEITRGLLGVERLQRSGWIEE